MLSLPFRAALRAVFGVAALTSSSVATPEARGAWQHLQQRAAAALRELEARPAPGGDVPLLPRVELFYEQLFEPIGERGLEYTAALRRWDGHPVQVTGFIVREAERAPGTFLVTARPLRTDVSGGSGDLPPAALHVVLAPSHADVRPGYRPGAITLVGVLRLGARPMPDGRNAVLCLYLDEAASRLAIGEGIP